MLNSQKRRFPARAVAEELGGRWLSISYLVGAQIAFIGFYNAMVIIGLGHIVAL